MEQLDLLAVPSAPLWTREVGASGGSCGARWFCRLGGYVEHCGHQTALWPYIGVTGEGRILVAPNGRGFRLLKDCQAAVLAAAGAAALQ